MKDKNKKSENESPFVIENNRRTVKLEDLIAYTKSKDELVKKVIELYNSKPENQNRLAIRGGTRKPRNEAEQRVLDSFTLK